MRYREIYYTVRKLLDDVPDYRWGTEGKYTLDPVAIRFWEETGGGFGALSGPPARLTHLNRRIRIGQYYTDEDIASALNAALNGLVAVLWETQELDWISPLISTASLSEISVMRALEDGTPVELKVGVLPSDFLFPLGCAIGKDWIAVQGGATAVSMLIGGYGDTVCGVGCGVDGFGVLHGGLYGYAWYVGSDRPVIIQYIRRPTPFVGTADYEGPRYNDVHPDRLDARVYTAVAYEAAAILRAADESSEADFMLHEVGMMAARALLGERLAVGREEET